MDFTFCLFGFCANQFARSSQDSEQIRQFPPLHLTSGQRRCCASPLLPRESPVNSRPTQSTSPAILRSRNLPTEPALAVLSQITATASAPRARPASRERLPSPTRFKRPHPGGGPVHELQDPPRAPGPEQQRGAKPPPVGAPALLRSPAAGSPPAPDVGRSLRSGPAPGRSRRLPGPRGLPGAASPRPGTGQGPQPRGRELPPGRPGRASAGGGTSPGAGPRVPRPGAAEPRSPLEEPPDGPVPGNAPARRTRRGGGGGGGRAPVARPPGGTGQGRAAPRHGRRRAAAEPPP